MFIFCTTSIYIVHIKGEEERKNKQNNRHNLLWVIFFICVRMYSISWRI